MRSRIDAHGNLIGIFSGDALVHLEEVAIAFGDLGGTEALDAVGEIEIHTEAARADAATFVALALGSARGDVARNKVAETRVAALEVVVALGFRDLVGRTFVARSLGYRCGRRCGAIQTSK